MSVKVMGWIWDSDLPQDEKLVALAYADHADHDGTNIFPAISSIAKKTGYSERSVQRITRKLEDRHLLLPDGDGPKGTRKWRMAVPPHVGGDILSPPRISARRGDNLSPPAVPNVTGGVTPVSPRGDIAMSPDSSLTVREPSMSPSSESSIEEAVPKYQDDDGDFTRVVKTWEKTAGPITAGIAEDMGDLIDELRPIIAALPPGSAGSDLSAEAWMVAAITEARQSSSNGRRPNVRFVQTILDRWRSQGFKSPYKAKDADDPARSDSVAPYFREDQVVR